MKNTSGLLKKIVIFNPTKKDDLSQHRGGGRMMQLLHENLSQEATFTSDLSDLSDLSESTLLIPSWSPFHAPVLNKRITNNQSVIIFDVIPLKYPDHFPAGIRGKVKLALNKRALQHFDKIITISEASKRDIVGYLNLPEDRVEVVYPTVCQLFTKPKSQAPKSRQITNSKPQIPNNRQSTINNQQLPAGFALYVGDVNWNKNLVNLARAIKIINVTCVFAGTMFRHVTRDTLHVTRKFTHPWQAEFKVFLDEVGDDRRFVFAGFVSDAELVQLYKKARLHVLVSRDEGFGLSFLEAATQKCPSVMSNIDVFREAAGDAALFANPDDPYAIANAMGELYFNPVYAHDLGEKAYTRTKHFSPGKFKDHLLKLLV